MLNGKQVILSEYALEETTEPVRKHQLKSWHFDVMTKTKVKLPYHDRIQKKWNKRYGFIKKPCIFETPQAFIINPALWPEIQKAMGNV